jgi:hypothetical protein
VAIPSAKVRTGAPVRGTPSCHASCCAGAPALCTAYTRSPGRIAAATTHAPTACEPPPSAITSASSAGTASRNSAVSVAAPAITPRSFVECTTVRPSRSAIAAHAATVSS